MSMRTKLTTRLLCVRACACVRVRACVCERIPQVVELLSKPVKGWPVVLGDYIPNEAEVNRRKTESQHTPNGTVSDSPVTNGTAVLQRDSDIQQQPAQQAAQQPAQQPAQLPAQQQQEGDNSSGDTTALKADHLPFYHGVLNRKEAEGVCMLSVLFVVCGVV